MLLTWWAPHLLVGSHLVLGVLPGHSECSFLLFWCQGGPGLLLVLLLLLLDGLEPLYDHCRKEAPVVLLLEIQQVLNRNILKNNDNLTIFSSLVENLKLPPIENLSSPAHENLTPPCFSNLFFMGETCHNDELKSCGASTPLCLFYLNITCIAH